MTKVELVDKGVYWVRRNDRTDGVPGELRLAQCMRMPLRSGGEWCRFDFFGTDDDAGLGDVIVVAGPLDIPPPPEPEKEAEK